MIYFLLATLAGYVLQFLGTLTVIRYVRSASTQEEFLDKKGFHAGMGTYCVGVVVKYCGLTLVIADLIKAWLLM